MIGEVPASSGHGAPTVLVYAHLDVQPPDPLELWESDPWTLIERDGKLFARGVADDKAHLFMLLKATELLAAAGELPVNVRFAIDAEEEVGGHSVVDWVEEDTGPADVAIILDGGYATETLPSICTALRGMCYFHLTLRTGERDLHSGMFGGAALTATHALMQVLSAVLPGPDGLLPEPLRAGIVPPTARRDRRLGRAAARAAKSSPRRERVRPMPPPRRSSTSAPPPSRRSRSTASRAARHGSRRRCSPSRRRRTSRSGSRPGRRRRRLRPCSSGSSARPRRSGRASTSSSGRRASPASSIPAAPAVRIAQDAFEHVLGTRPVLTRSGGTIPVVAAIGARGIPAIVTGFARPTARIHSPNEHVPASALRDGLTATVELLRRLAAIESPSRRALRLRRALDSRYASPLAEELGEEVLERFLRYVVVDTQSEPDSTTLSVDRPSSSTSRASSSRSFGRSASTTSS